MRRTLVIAALAVLLLAAAGCSRYTSSYSAVGFVHSNGKHSAFLSFHSLSGRMVMTLRTREAGLLGCEAKLEEGNLRVYCDSDGDRRELFSLSAGQDVDLEFWDMTAKKVHIIVETDGRCRNGYLEFEMQ